ncbi:MAG: hypothetical protein AAF628_24455 [Planctomycetota bacterium]
MSRDRAEAASALTTGNRTTRALGLLLALGVAACFAWHVAHYYFVSDDAYISFRYSLNLVEGHGLVYNPGERVEGYSNFLWVLMAAATIALGLAPEIPANALGIASGATILLSLVALSRRGSGWLHPLVWVAPACLAANRTFTAWSTGALATQFFAALVLLALLAYLAERRSSASRPAVSALLFAAAALTRPEGPLFFAIAAAFFAADVFVLGRRRVGSLAMWLTLFALVVGTHVAWRWSYYGYPLPNTYYAKVAGFWWESSRVWMGLFVTDHHIAWVAPLPLLGLLLRRDHTAALLATTVATYTAYLLYIGGDFFEYRLTTPILPLWYWLAQEGIREVARRLRRILPGGLILALGLLGGAALVFTAHAPTRHGFDAGGHKISSLEGYRQFTDSRVEQGKFLASLVDQGILRGDEVLCVRGAGALPYFSRLPTLDYHGLTDAFVAHQPTLERGWVAHEKRAPREYIEQRGAVIWDVENRIVRPPGARQPRPHRVRTAFYEGPVCCVKAADRYLVFATTLTQDAFREAFERCEVVFYRRRP